VREGWSPELERALREQRLDLVLSHSIPPSGDLAASTLRREPLVAVVHARHPLAGRSAVALRELRDETFCFLPRALAPGYYDQVVSALHALGEDFVVWEHPVPGLRLPPLRDDGTGFSLVTASAGERLGHDMVSLAVLDDLPAIDVQIVRRAAEDAPCVHRVLAVARDLARSWAPPAVG
jgi:DNA-binding transcriptional LysR family regulator